jgi:hypothetical protein
MRDDRLGGHEQLAEVLAYLQRNNLAAAALGEKAEAVRLWERVVVLARQIEWRDPETRQFASVSAQYGLKLFRVVEAGWRVLLVGVKPAHENELESALWAYDEAWADYQLLALQPGCPTLYTGSYFNLPGQPEVCGLESSIRLYKQKLEHTNAMTART